MTTANAAAPVLIKNLSVSYNTDAGRLNAVTDLSLTVEQGEILGIVGESGSGKTTVANAILGLLRRDVIEGTAAFVHGTDIINASGSALTKLRRYYMAAILQDPLGSLNPVRTVRSQLVESQRAVGSTEKSHETIDRILEDVGLNPARLLHKYPHELSGGMNQRVAIAMALLKNPQLLVADEPTSALDVRTQAAIIRLLMKIRERRGTSIIIITHDLELALGTCDRVAVMYAGRLVEIGQPATLRDGALHPYTRALLATAPRFGDRTRVKPIPGRFASVMNDARGCPFITRCEQADSRCEVFPAPTIGAGSTCWCWRPGDYRHKDQGAQSA